MTIRGLHTEAAGTTAAVGVPTMVMAAMLSLTVLLAVTPLGVSAAQIVGSSTSYVSASNTCASQSQRLCTATELQAAAGSLSDASVWVLAAVGDTGAFSGSISGHSFAQGGSREDFFSANHQAACCDFGDIGVSNFFATDFTATLDSCAAGYDTSVDLNRGAGGKTIRMCTKYTRADSIASNGQMLADLTVISGSSSSISCPSGYSKVAQELNQGAKGSYVYFCTLFSTTDSRTIVDTYIADGKAAPCLDGYTRIDQDLNQGAGGDFLYLCFKRTNRQLTYLAEPSSDPAKIAKFSPGFHLSQRERFFPTSIPSLLASTASAIYRNNGARSSDSAFVFPMAADTDPSPCTAAMIAAGDCTPIKTQDAFLNYANVDDSYCFGFSASNVYEEHTDWYANDRTDARVYYAVQRAPSGAHENVAITFVLIYRWNGCVHYYNCQPSMRLCSAGAIYPHVQHMGDIERLSVVVDRSFSRLIGVEVEKHGNMKGYPLLDYPSGFTGTFGASGPHVYIAAETHGVFPTSDTSNPGQDGWTQECHACSGCSDCVCYDPVWVAGVDQLVRVGKKMPFPHASIPNDATWVDREYWQQFSGRFGCGASIDSADKTGVGSFKWRWYVGSATYPTTWQPPVASVIDWH